MILLFNFYQCNHNNLLTSKPISTVSQPSYHSTEAAWDPWDMNAGSQPLIPSSGSTDKGKRKTSPEPQQSSRLQQNLTTSAGTSKSNNFVVGSSSVGTDHFLFVSFKDAEVMTLLLDFL
jgi:hypothetical protein